MINKVYLGVGIVIVAVLVVLLFNNQYVAKKYGGSYTITLDKGKRLENITWKDNELWILTKEDTSIKPTTYTLQEDSTFNLIEGTITIKEQ